MSGSERLGKTPEAFVLDYITGRRQWEIDAADGLANAQASGNVDDELDELDRLSRTYFTVMTRFVAPDVLKQLSMNMETPTHLDPATTAIVNVVRRGDKAQVTTEEASHSDERYRYEYRLRIVIGEWRLEEVRSRGLDGRWMKMLF